MQFFKIFECIYAKFSDKYANLLNMQQVLYNIPLYEGNKA